MRYDFEDRGHVVLSSELDDMVIKVVVCERGDLRVVEDIEGCFNDLTMFNEFIVQWASLSSSLSDSDHVLEYGSEDQDA